MIVLGLDPGTVKFGWAVVQFGSGRPVVRAFGVIEPDGKLTRAQRLAAIHRALIIVASFSPSIAEAAIEGGYVGTNGQSSLAIAEARGVAAAVCANAGIEVVIVSPSAGKIAATGTGAASKDLVQHMVAAQCELPEGVGMLPTDASDAVAVAMAAAGYKSALDPKAQARARKKKSTPKSRRAEWERLVARVVPRPA